MDELGQAGGRGGEEGHRWGKSALSRKTKKYTDGAKIGAEVTEGMKRAVERRFCHGGMGCVGEGGGSKFAREGGGDEIWMMFEEVKKAATRALRVANGEVEVKGSGGQGGRAGGLSVGRGGVGLRKTRCEKANCPLATLCKYFSQKTKWPPPLSRQPETPSNLFVGACRSHVRWATLATRISFQIYQNNFC